ncbi:MAG: peptidoglycan DD-metalloendopeptidase family protein, partial [Spirochaetota bacterium]|nr:peptidoglycan DD-metalloendopeptidase family protein [Spirochaetota bacterium]
TEDKQYSDFFWPHSGERVSMRGKLRGEEILGNKGDEIVSVSTGKVVWVAPYRGYGRLIMVETNDHHIFAYGGNEETLVSVGDLVYPGTTLGLMGLNSIERNAKAFFFVYKDGKPVDTEKAPRS